MAFENIITILDHAWSAFDIPCSDIAISKNGQVVFRYRNGTKDDLRQEPLKGDELYFLYSATKLMTCTAALQLYERGLLDLEDEVSKFIPEYKNVQVKSENGMHPIKSPMRIKHLLTMTSGMNYDIKNSVIREQSAKNPNSTTQDLVKAFARIPLEFEPGTHFKYSLSHDVIAAIIEIVTDMTFGEYLKKNIFEVCGMENTYLRYDAALKSRICAQYSYYPQTDTTAPVAKENPFVFTPFYESGGAGAVSSVDDYMRFANALIRGEMLLKRSTLDLMRADHLPAQAYQDFQDVKRGYSYGLGVRTNVRNEFSSKGEFGWDGAAGAYVLLDPDNQLAVFYATHVRGRGDYLYNALHLELRDEIYRTLGLRDG